MKMSRSLPLFRPNLLYFDWLLISFHSHWEWKETTFETFSTGLVLHNPGLGCVDTHHLGVERESKKERKGRDMLISKLTTMIGMGITKQVIFLHYISLSFSPFYYLLHPHRHHHERWRGDRTKRKTEKEEGEKADAFDYFIQLNFPTCSFIYQ